MAEKKGHDTSFYQFLLFSQTLPRKIDRLVWHITLPCVAKKQHNRTGHINLPTHQPYAPVSSSSPWGPGYAGENAGPNDIATPWSFLFLRTLDLFSRRIEQGIFAWKMKVKNIPYNLILINLLHLLRISDHLFQTINVWKVHWWFFHRMSCHHPVNSIPIPGKTLVRRLEKIEKRWRKMRPYAAYHIKCLNKNIFHFFFAKTVITRIITFLVGNPY